MNILLVKFDSREREKSIIYTLKQLSIPNQTIDLQNVGPAAFIRTIETQMIHHKSDILIFVGLHRHILLWRLRLLFRGRLPYIIRLGGDPLGVPDSRMKGLPRTKLSLWKGYLRRLGISTTLYLSRNYILANIQLAELNELTKKNCFAIPPLPKYSRSRVQKKPFPSSGNFRALCVTNLNYYEKFVGVIQILETLTSARCFTNFDILIAGDGEYFGQLEAKVRELPSESSNSITLLGHVKDVDQLYSSSDVFIYSSSLDSWPNVIMEAMTFGLPIICNNHKSFRNIFNHKQQKYLYSSEKELLNDVSRLVIDPIHYEHRSSMSFSRVNEVYESIENNKAFKEWLVKIMLEHN